MSYGNYSSRLIHQEFGDIIRDLKLNEHSAKRNKVKWRETADENYYHSPDDLALNYDHHKIEGKLFFLSEKILNFFRRSSP
jgi:hypothetical protein